MRRAEQDPVIDEVRDARCHISERFGNDPARLIAHYQKLQERHRDRMIHAERTSETKETAAA